MTEKVFFDVAIEGQPDLCGRIVMGLYGNAVPKTVANFVALGEGLQWEGCAALCCRVCAKCLGVLGPPDPCSETFRMC